VADKPKEQDADQSVRTNKQIVKFPHDMDVLIPSYILYRILYTSAVSRNQIISNYMNSMMPSAYHCRLYIFD
jgi:hypothetical protein